MTHDTAGFVIVFMIGECRRFGAEVGNSLTNSQRVYDFSSIFLRLTGCEDVSSVSSGVS